jgi:hypothetical protein
MAFPVNVPPKIGILLWRIKSPPLGGGDSLDDAEEKRYFHTQGRLVKMNGVGLVLA